VGLQAVLRLIYPPQCLGCGEMVTSEFGLCGTCWRETAFISGLVCDTCGTPLPGENPGHSVHCDDCLATERPWSQGRAALLYKDMGRKLVLRLKHGDRHDIARPAAAWMHRVALPLLQTGMIVAPVPLHWSRLLQRRFNQSALLSSALARLAGLDHCPDLLLRTRRTGSQGTRNREDRFGNLVEAIRAHPRRKDRMDGRSVLLVDDVMTSGATLASCAEACLAAGASDVKTVVLARVAKGD